MRVLSTPTEASHLRGALRSVRLSPDFISLGILTLVTLVFAWDKLQLDRQISSVDNPTFVIPMFAELGARLRHGDIPGWLPSIFSGIPFAGDPQSGWMYLPAMVLFAVLPVLTAFKAFVVLHLLIAGFSMYALSRLLGLGPMGSLTAAIVFELAPLLKYTICCFPFPQVTAWVPLSLVGIELAVCARSWLGRSGGWVIAGFAISQILAGWIGQGAYYGLLAAGSYLIFRTLISPPMPTESMRKRFINLFLQSVGVFGFAFGLAAAGVLPRLDAVSRSTRAGGISATNNGEFNGWSFAHGIVTLLEVDRGQGRWYIGGSVLALAIIAPFMRHRAIVIYFVVFSMTVLILTLDKTPIHNLFFLLPKFSVIHEHIPSRILIIFWIGPAFLAGTTVDAIAQQIESTRRVILGIVGGIALMLIGVVYVHQSGEHFDQAALIVMALTVIVTLLAAVLRSPWASEKLHVPAALTPFVLVLLLLIIVWDTAGRTFGQIDDVDTPQAMAAAADVSPSSGAAAFLLEKRANSTPFRYFGYDTGSFAGSNWRGGYRVEFRDPSAQELLVNNRAIALGLDDVQGYDPIQVGRYLDYINALNGYKQEYHELDVFPSAFSSSLLNLSNARYIIVPAAVPPGRPDLLHLSQRFPTVFADDRVRILENGEALPRAWIVHDAKEVEKGAALTLLSKGMIDPTKTVLIERAPPDMSDPTDQAAESVSFVSASGDEIKLTVKAAAPGMIVMSDAYDPDWKAFVDGQQVPIYAADHAFRGIPIPAGDHTIKLQYEPLTLKIGLLISFAFMLLSFGIAVALAVRSYRERKGSSAL